MNRRQFLISVAMGATAICALSSIRSANAATPSTRLSVTKRTLDINGRSASVFGLTDPSGRPGLLADADSTIDLQLANDTTESTLIHWHGLTPPWKMDGVPDNPAAQLKPGETRAYGLPAGEGGTQWMHAHTLQEQNLLAAPLIVRTAEDRAADEQEVVVMLHDFSFKSPEELLEGLKKGGMSSGMGMDHSKMMGAMPGMQAMHQMMSGGSGMDMQISEMNMGMDVNDIAYDAYLANDRTLEDPEVVTVEKGGRVRLRIINGATATGFTVDTGALSGDLIAVDGRPVVAISGNRFPISTGQRLDIRLQLPPGQGRYPVLALREGATERTGIILATTGARIEKITGSGSDNGAILDLSLEQRLRAITPLQEKEPNRKYSAMLGGDMASYTWGIQTDQPIVVKKGERVRLDLMNMSMMAHPIHLHGHQFQVVAINGTRIAGAVRDTVLMPPLAALTIDFDADNPGRWPLHCHHLYHMASGMMPYVTYEDLT